FKIIPNLIGDIALRNSQKICRIVYKIILGFVFNEIVLPIVGRLTMIIQNQQGVRLISWENQTCFVWFAGTKSFTPVDNRTFIDNVRFQKVFFFFKFINTYSLNWLAIEFQAIKLSNEQVAIVNIGML